MKLSRCIPLIGVLAFLLPQVAGARRPGRRQCSAQTRSKLVRLARTQFPGYGLKDSGLCTHFGDDRQINFGSFVINAHKRLQFHVESSMAILAAPEEDFFSEPATTKKRIFRMAPFASPKAASRVAKQLLAHPVIKRAFGSKKVYCVASTNAPGGLAYFTCAAAIHRSTSISDSSASQVARVAFHQILHAKKPKAPYLESYALKKGALHPTARRWAQAKKHATVRAFLKKHRNLTVVLKNWHRDYLTLIPVATPKNPLTVVFQRARGRNFRALTPISTVCTGLSPLKCIFKAKR